jgi:hypothetical protein
MLNSHLGIPVVESAMPLGDCYGCGPDHGLGLITSEVTATLGAEDKPGGPSHFVHGKGTALGVHWSIWLGVVGAGALSGATTGYVVAPKKKKGSGSMIGAAGGAIGGALALAILSQI